MQRLLVILSLILATAALVVSTHHPERAQGLAPRAAVLLDQLASDLDAGGHSISNAADVTTSDGASLASAVQPGDLGTAAYSSAEEFAHISQGVYSDQAGTIILWQGDGNSSAHLAPWKSEIYGGISPGFVKAVLDENSGRWSLESTGIDYADQDGRSGLLMFCDYDYFTNTPTCASLLGWMPDVTYGAGVLTKDQARTILDIDSVSNAGITNSGSVVASRMVLSYPRWMDVTAICSFGFTGPTRTLAITGAGIYGLGYNPSNEADFMLQVQHGVASTNSAFSVFYYEPHIHVVVPALTSGETNMTWRLIHAVGTVDGTFGSPITNTVTASATVTNQSKVISFGYVTNNLISGRDSVVILGNLSRIASASNDIVSRVVVNSIDFHFPFTEIGSENINGDAP